MIARPNIYSSPGGDTTQILMTAKYLKEMGVKVDVTVPANVSNVGVYDIIHFFNIIRPDDILPFTNNLNIPYCISSIFVDYSEYEKKNRAGIAGIIFKNLSSGHIEYLKAVARWILNGEKVKSSYYITRGHKAAIQKAARNAAILLPNSNNEAKRFNEYSGLSVPYKKVVNAIDDSTFKEDVTPNENFRDHVLCVGRIEGRKNQYNLIKALAGTEFQLTIIGKPSPNHISYFESCKSLASGFNNIHFIEHIDHKELVSIYQAAKIHVLPSWFETTGLSSLEAGVMNCNLVITDKGDTREYFQDMAFYCQPDDVQSIKIAVEKAFYQPVNPNLKSFILRNYTWKDAASQTFEAYQEVLKKHKKKEKIPTAI